MRCGRCGGEFKPEPVALHEMIVQRQTPRGERIFVHMEPCSLHYYNNNPEGNETMKVWGDHRGWFVSADWHGEDRIVHGPVSVFEAIDFKADNS